MNDKEFKRNAFIVAAVVIVGLLLWFMNGRAQAQATANPAMPVYTGTGGGPTFIVQGPSLTAGPLKFPQAIYNITNGPGNPGDLNAGNCSCGCDGSGGNTTVNFQLPSLQGLINELAANAAATNQANLQSSYASMGYSQAVFVSDGSRTIFNGGNPF